MPVVTRGVGLSGPTKFLVDAGGPLSLSSGESAYIYSEAGADLNARIRSEEGNPTRAYLIYQMSELTPCALVEYKVQIWNGASWSGIDTGYIYTFEDRGLVVGRRETRRLPWEGRNLRILVTLRPYSMAINPVAKIFMGFEAI